MSDDLFYWTFESTRVKDCGVSPIQVRAFISSLWRFLERRCRQKGVRVEPSCATSSRCWLYYLPSIHSSCPVCYRASVQAPWKQNLARIRSRSFSKGFFNLKHPSLHPRVQLLDCFPTKQLVPMLVCVCACVYVYASHPHRHTSPPYDYLFFFFFTCQLQQQRQNYWEAESTQKCPNLFTEPLRGCFLMVEKRDLWRAPAPAPSQPGAKLSPCPRMEIPRSLWAASACSSFFPGVLVELPVLLPDR